MFGFCVGLRAAMLGFLVVLLLTTAVTPARANDGDTPVTSVSQARYAIVMREYGPCDSR